MATGGVTALARSAIQWMFPVTIAKVLFNSIEDNAQTKVNKLVIVQHKS
jgi:hypothetical protein